jgi:hypothetical protein
MPLDLEQLVQAQFDRLSDAEVKLLHAAPKGETAYCGPSEREDDLDNDPARWGSWGHKREIRAELIRWLCVDRDAKDRVDPRGIRVHAARIAGKLDLSFVGVPFPLSLHRCGLCQHLDLSFTEIPSVDLSETCLPSLNALHATVKGDLNLRDLRSKGPVQLSSASIGGTLDCDGAQLQNPAKPNVSGSGTALNAGHAKVAGDVLLRNGFVAEGTVWLYGAEIGGLDCGGGKFQNPAKANIEGSGMALIAEGAKIAGPVYLRNGFAAEGLVRLYGAEIKGNLECSRGKFQNPAKPGVAWSGVALEVATAKVEGAVILRDGFEAEGLVRLQAAEIGADLACGGGKFQNPAVANVSESGTALNAEGAKVVGAVHLRDGFAAEGAVRLYGAEIGGTFTCDDGKFQNPAVANVPGSGVALVADGVRVARGALLRKCFAEGEVRLVGAKIGGNLACDGSNFQNPAAADVPGSGMALIADGAKVAGGVLLRNGFAAKGEVRLSGAEIGVTLECDGGKFQNPTVANVPGSGAALVADGTKVAGAVLFRDGFAAEGTVRLYGAQIGGHLECRLGTFESLVLTNASVGAILDDESSWPKPGSLFLDGFVYRHISGGPVSAAERLGWLARQASFTRQPYRQLAKVLREAGDDRGWRRVCAEMEQKTWAGRGWIVRGLTWLLLGRTIGYGYFPARALRLLLLLVIVGSLVYWRGYAAGNIVPTSKDAYESFLLHKDPPPYYEAFHSLPYSLENSFPLVKLGVQDKWAPNANGRGLTHEPVGWTSRFSSHIASPSFLRCFRWLQISVGWILATLFVAGVTGVIRRD